MCVSPVAWETHCDTKQYLIWQILQFVRLIFSLLASSSEQTVSCWLNIDDCQSYFLGINFILFTFITTTISSPTVSFLTLPACGTPFHFLGNDNLLKFKHQRQSLFLAFLNPVYLLSFPQSCLYRVFSFIFTHSNPLRTRGITAFHGIIWFFFRILYALLVIVCIQGLCEYINKIASSTAANPLVWGVVNNVRYLQFWPLIVYLPLVYIHCRCRLWSLKADWLLYASNSFASAKPGHTDLNEIPSERLSNTYLPCRHSCIKGFG